MIKKSLCYLASVAALTLGVSFSHAGGGFGGGGPGGGGFGGGGPGGGGFGGGGPGGGGFGGGGPGGGGFGGGGQGGGGFGGGGPGGGGFGGGGPGGGGPGGGGFSGGGPGGGGFGNGMAGMPGNVGGRGTMTLQAALSSPDDEWAVLSPKVQRIIDVQTQLSAMGSTSRGGGFGGGGMGGFGGGGMGGYGNMTGGAAGGTSAITTALSDLNSVLQDPTQGDAVVKAKLQTYRDTVKAAQEQLKAAREDLRTYVTLRQEAILMGLGYLD